MENRINDFSRTHKLLSPRIGQKSRQKKWIINAFTISPFETHLTKYVIVFFFFLNKCNTSNVVNPTKPFFKILSLFFPAKQRKFIFIFYPSTFPSSLPNIHDGKLKYFVSSHFSIFLFFHLPNQITLHMIAKNSH